MEFVVFDLEATCEDKNINPRFINEIIEIGAVKINEKGIIVDKFSKFAKPYDNVKLTDFCTNLTTIKQEDIDKAEDLSDVLIQFYEWSFNCTLLSWGGYDMRQLSRDIKNQFIHDIIDVTDMENRHIDLKRWYAKKKKIKPTGMFYALKHEKLELTGTHHRGIDDAFNISKIFLKYINEFKK